ncbi:MAG: DegV family protein [Eubacteriales bacterium]|nr:DegV family protein [Eubacteriales bacterium]
MGEYVITTDNNADLPDEYYHDHEVGCTYLSYNIDGQAYTHETFLPVEEFYQKMREGSMPTTAQVNPEQARELFEPVLKQGKDILHIAFSSGLSGTYNSVKLAAEELLEEYPGRTIRVLDSLCASLGQGLLVHEAVLRREQGVSLEENAQWVENHKKNIVHMFTVDDLFHLHRGGRVSKATAVVGSMLNLKPVLHVDDEGRLVAIGKARGRKKSLLALVDGMKEKIGSYADGCHTIFISHGDCEEEARFVERKVKEIYDIDTVIINYVGPVIGAHSGPGTMALFFLGDKR